VRSFFEGLNGRERDTVRIDRRDVAIVFADSERSVEILGHRTDVPDGGILRFCNSK
jgi:hypothetical protein